MARFTKILENDCLRISTTCIVDATNYEQIIL